MNRHIVCINHNNVTRNYRLSISIVSCLSGVRKDPVKLADFESYVEGMHENANHGFSLEYSVITILLTHVEVPVIYGLDVCSSWERKVITIALP